MDAEVTVIVPLYNKGPYVGRALDSIAAQTFDRFEALIIDDGSTDDGASVAEHYPDPRFRLIRQPNQGPGAARNRGLSQARGEFVAFLDADDEWLPGYLEHAVNRLRGTKEAAYACSYLEDPGGVSSEPLWRRRGLLEGTFEASADTAPEVFLHTLAFLTPCTTVARTEVVRKWGGFYENRCLYAEDAFLWLKVLLNCPVGVDLRPRVRIHREAASLSGGLGGPHPLEPFLEHPDQVEASCAPALRPLLASLLTIRAFKTACVLGVWGRWQEAGTLRARFRSQRDFRLPYFWSSLICATPLGAALGAAVRRWKTQR